MPSIVHTCPFGSFPCPESSNHLSTIISPQTPVDQSPSHLPTQPTTTRLHTVSPPSRHGSHPPPSPVSTLDGSDAPRRRGLLVESDPSDQVFIQKRVLGDTERRTELTAGFMGLHRMAADTTTPLAYESSINPPYIILYGQYSIPPASCQVTNAFDLLTSFGAQPPLERGDLAPGHRSGSTCTPFKT